MKRASRRDTAQQEKRTYSNLLPSWPDKTQRQHHNKDLIISPLEYEPSHPESLGHFRTETLSVSGKQTVYQAAGARGWRFLTDTNSLDWGGAHSFLSTTPPWAASAPRDSLF